MKPKLELNDPGKDEPGNGARKIEKPSEGMRSNSPVGTERLNSKGRSYKRSDERVNPNKGTPKVQIH